MDYWYAFVICVGLLQNNAIRTFGKSMGGETTSTYAAVNRNCGEMSKLKTTSTAAQKKSGIHGIHEMPHSFFITTVSYSGNKTAMLMNRNSRC